jgi:16S rRNA (guanine966-N2)-methyltransferase
MTRIIAGEFGGRRIAVPPRGTRPTTDRVREALFSKLDHAEVLRGAKVIDLCAGSGALGIEALSRGAAHATFVEAGRSAAVVIQQNLAAVGATQRGIVATSRAAAFLDHDQQMYSLALIDPPYDMPVTDLTAILHALPARLEPEATVVLEWSTRGAPPAWPAELEPASSKDYGDTRLHFARRLG